MSDAATLDDSAFHYVIERTTDHDRSLLDSARFVHVSGLEPRPDSGCEYQTIGFGIRLDHIGRHGYTKLGSQVLVTAGNEVWIKHLARDVTEKEAAFDKLLCSRLCPDGDGLMLDLSENRLDALDLMGRFSDPNYEPPSRH